MTTPGANSGIFIRTTVQPTDWPSQEYEVQINNSQSDWRRTRSLHAVQDVREAGRGMTDGRQTADYTEPAGSATRLTGGTIALQWHDPGSEVHYRNITIRPLAP